MEFDGFTIKDTSIYDYFFNYSIRKAEAPFAAELTYKIENGSLTMEELVNAISRTYTLKRVRVEFELFNNPDLAKALKERNVTMIHHIAYAYSKLSDANSEAFLGELMYKYYGDLQDKSLADERKQTTSDIYEWFAAVGLSKKIENYNFMDFQEVFDLILVVFNIPAERIEELKKDSVFKYCLEKKSIMMVKNALQQYIDVKVQ